MLGRTIVAGAPIRFCLTNLLDGVGITGSTEASGFPASNIATPYRPMMPWHTTALGAQSAVIDFLSAKTLTGIWLIRTNFAQVTIQGHATDTWTSPSFTQTMTVARNPWNFRYQLAIPLHGFTFRFLRILIPSQTPTDGTSAYVLGGVHAGVLESFPQDILYDVEFTTVQPRKDVPQPDNAWRERLIMGEPYARLSLTRTTKVTRLAPGYGDDVRRWQEIERRISEINTFALMLGSADTSQGFIVRSINEGHQKWTRTSLLRMKSTIELEESMR